MVEDCKLMEPCVGSQSAAVMKFLFLVQMLAFTIFKQINRCKNLDKRELQHFRRSDRRKLAAHAQLLSWFIISLQQRFSPERRKAAPPGVTAIIKQGAVVKSGSQQLTSDAQDVISSKYENNDELINGSETQVSPALPQSSANEPASEENCLSARDSRYVPPNGEVNIPIDVDTSLSSSFTLLVFYVREHRETVAESQKIEVGKCFKNQVTLPLQINKLNQEPKLSSKSHLLTPLRCESSR
ncbi:hypothetical protein AVEN_131716-1 [Araneus ventricosus]|uniref:Alpha-2-macroglobulin bait region domain-containing protein n=1 Tax=Araneus ventricosus TaxID=182803 RepID=A0A4Y2RVA0_ARAVE|nr:hypothetical protein AVEN_131716-1 [Araneus ventricosus]